MIDRFWVVCLLAGVASVFSACQRSPQFRRDQETYSPEAASYYYRPRNSAQRAETIGQPKKRAMVLNFWNDTPVREPQLGAFVADELRRGLQLTERLILPADSSAALSTQDFVSHGNVQVAQLIREGRRLGVGVLVVGRLTRVSFRQRGDDIGFLKQKQTYASVGVEIKVFDVAGGREVSAVAKMGEASSQSNTVVDVEGEGADSLKLRSELAKLASREAAAQLIPDVLKAVEKMAWEGRVAKISGKRFYLNAGKASGLVAGDILRVMAPGDDVYDPTTGAFLGRTDGQMKGTLEVVDFLGTDGAVAELNSGGNVQEGDAVRLY